MVNQRALFLLNGLQTTSSLEDALDHTHQALRRHCYRHLYGMMERNGTGEG